MSENKSPEKRVSIDNLTKIFAIVKGWISTALDTIRREINNQQFKTINGESIKGSGDITIDPNLYIIVSSLPKTGIKDNRIYLVPLTGGIGETSYAEYVHTSGGWEKLGDFRPSVDLADYAKRDELPVFASYSEEEIMEAATAAIEAVSSSEVSE